MNLETKIDRELWLAVRRSYESQAWANSILDAVHFLGDSLRLKSGLQSDGTALVGQALGGKAPKLRLNRLQTDSEKNVQAGVEQLLRGLYMGVRNPRSHERTEDSQADADALVLFVDYLLRVIGHARSAFSTDDCVRRIVEDSFVPNKRYAAILVNDIPARQRLQVALSVFQKKSEGDGKKLKYFFDAVLEVLTDDEKNEFFEAISQELRDSNDDSSLMSVLQIMEPADWLKLDEAARLRSEYRLLAHLKDGRFSPETERCLSGAIATWCKSFLKHFALKEDFYLAILQKLRSSSLESQDYVLRYFWYYIDELTAKPSVGLQNIMEERLRAGDARFKDAAEGWAAPWQGELWNDKVKAALAAFEPVTQAAPRFG